MQDFPPFRLDPINQCLWRLREPAPDERILLPPKAFAVLRYLVAHAGQLVTQDELLAAVWPETHVQPEVLKSRIFEVRSALGDRPKTPRFIETLPRRGYRFIAPVHASPAAASVLPAPPAPGHLVGRAGLLETLRACLHRAMQGQRQLVFVTGEPGIGKTALVDTFQQQVTVDVPGLRLARGQCLEGYGGMEAYYPMLEALGAVCREAGSAAIIEMLATHAPTWLVQFPVLMTRAHRDTLQRELQGATRERMLREMAELLEVLTADQPFLLVLEDLQWVDPATVDVLAALARRRVPAHLSVCAVAAHQEPEDCEALCESLARRQRLVRAVGAQQLPDGSMTLRYAFVHAMYRDVLYWRQVPGRRAVLHRRLGARLEEVFATQLSDVAAELAYHFEAGAAWGRAITYLRRVADTAAQRYAHREAATTLQHALTLVPHLPESPERAQHALPLYLALGIALQTVKGPAAPDVEHAYSQTRALCQQAEETPELVPVLFGLWRLYLMRPQLHTALALGDTLQRLAQHADDPALAVVAHYALGSTWLFLGALPAARPHLEAGIAHYTPAQRGNPVFRMGPDLGVTCRCYAAWTLWLLGYPARALVRLHEAQALAHALSHPFSLAFVWCVAAFVAQFGRDVPAVRAHAEAAVTLSTAQAFPLWVALGTSIRGWALAMQGQDAEGLAQVRQGIAAYRATGAVLTVPFLCTVLADVCAHLGHPADGLQALAEAHTLVEQQEERWWEAEVCRLQGVMLLPQTQTPPAEAEAWMQRALDVARRQEAKALELRAAMSLARLWQQQGQRAEAQALLAPI